MESWRLTDRLFRAIRDISFWSANNFWSLRCPKELSELFRKFTLCFQDLDHFLQGLVLFFQLFDFGIWQNNQRSWFNWLSWFCFWNLYEKIIIAKYYFKKINQKKLNKIFVATEVQEIKQFDESFRMKKDLRYEKWNWKFVCEICNQKNEYQLVCTFPIK